MPRTEIVAKTQEVAGHLADQVREQVTSQLAQQKDRAADTAESITGAFMVMREHLREEHQTLLAECADWMAETAEQLGSFVRDKDIDQLAGDVEEFARRQPALFLTGTFALGFLASRFFRSSSNGSGSHAGAQGNGAGVPGWKPAWEERTGVAAPIDTVPAPSTAAPVMADGSEWRDASAATPQE
jgi:hypothetical protein